VNPNWFPPFCGTPLKRALIVIALTVCTISSATSVRSAPLEPYEINAIIPLTGAGAFLGKSYVETFRAIEKVVNSSGGIEGRPIKFVTADTQTNPQVGVELVNGLIAKKVPFFIDGAPSTVCLASIPLVVNNGPLDYCLSPVIHPPAGSYVFSTSASTFDLASVAVRYLRERGWKRVAMITSTDATGQEYDRQIAAILSLPENHDMQLAAHEHFNPSDISVNAQISRLKSADAQAILAYTTGTPLGTVLRGLGDAGLTQPVITLNSNMSYAQMSAYASFLPKELYFTTLRSGTPEGTSRGPLHDAELAYVKAYRAIDVRPDVGDVLAYDPTMIIIDALHHLGTQATARQIRDYILHLHGWIGANGVYDFSGGDQRGIGQNSIVVARWAPAQNTWVQVSRPRGTLK
jgi:branched-chain amino acid transport system substrate-binding protein